MSDDEAHLSRRNLPANGAPDASAPLAGIIICCTSVPEEDRTRLAGYAEQMGATHRYDLTLDVTHLIVGDYDTPKYRYVAKERPDVKPMTTKWIEVLRGLWINDQEIDLGPLEKEYALPTLHSLKFSMTGCDNPDERLEIAEQVKENGAIYEGDLTKQITHLISFRTEGAKYKAARAWGIRVVSLEWLRDSLERGMILDERLYDPVLPAEERGKGAWDKTKPTRTSLGKRFREDIGGSSDGPKRKLRRTASTKLNSQSEKIWGDIVGGGTVTEVERSGVWDNVDEPDLQKERTNPKQLYKTGVRQPLADTTPIMTGIFSGCRFFFSGFDSKRAEVLCSHLLPQGAEIVGRIDELQSIPEVNAPSHLFVVLPHDLPASKHPTLPESQPPVEKITVWWVERCLHHKRFISPTDHVVGRPFRVFPIEEFSGMMVCSSAFSGIDLLHFKKSVELLGAIYSEDMTPQSSVLVTKCTSGLRKDKFEHAEEWKIPIVTADWLWDCIKSGTALKWQKYKCRSRKKVDSLPNTSGKPLSKDMNSNGLPKTLAEMHLSRSKSLPSEVIAKATKNSGLDGSALMPNQGLAVKEEENSYSLQPPTEGSASPTQKPPEGTEAVKGDHSSSSKTVSTAPAPSGHPHRRPVSEDISSAISDLLAKTKTSVHPTHPEPSDGRKRGANRILGRATSNVSAASTTHSRATSVDSTATHGHPVEYPSGLADKRMAMLLAGDRSTHNEGESQPPPTQLEYEDPESNEVTERVMARMLGDRMPPKKKGIKERAVTIGDFEPRSRATRQGRVH